jgi:hypothetical protein
MPDTRPAHPWRQVLLVSLSVTAACALFALGISSVIGSDYLRTFIYLRWFAVLVLLVSPLVHRLVLAKHSNITLPWVMQTPATALLLAVESILVDIIVGQLTD